MREPNEVLTALRQRFHQDYPTWARAGGTWPMRISLQPPTIQQRADDPIGCHTWARTWTDYRGPGQLTHANLRFPTGTHSMPKTLTLKTPGEAAFGDPDTTAIWKRCGQRLTTLQRSFPHTDFTGLIRRITELDEADYQCLIRAATWLHSNPSSGMLLRQLPIEGLDTKWLANHARLVLALLGDKDNNPNETPPTLGSSSRRRLHERLGLRLPPELIQVAVLCPELRAGVGSMRHFAASAQDLSNWTRQPHTVLIIENKETGYAFTEDHPGTVVLHGQGLNVGHYAHINWVPRAHRIIYWGDIDAPGLQFVSDLRRHGIPAATALMDLPTLSQFHHLAVDGAGPQRTNLPNLTDNEHNLYTHLVEHATNHGIGLLLEQERIPWSHAYELLAPMLTTGKPAAEN